MSDPKRILVCGHKSFAAKGLEPFLAAKGHSVVNFSRGRVAQNGNTVSGPVDQIHDNPHLTGDFHTVINYILLKDDTAERNNEYLASLIKFCQTRNVRHLIHISSVSVYDSTVTLVDESARVETDPNKKGAYGALKVATDLYLSKNFPQNITLTMLRPGFILAPGLINPIIGMGFRMPGNQILLLGSKDNRVSVITRDIVNQALVATVDAKPDDNRQVVLVVDSDGPTRKEYLQEACKRLGCGTRVVSFPVPLWLLAAMGGDVMAKVAGMTVKPYKLISAACREQVFDSRRTERKLNLSFKCDWRQALTDSMDGQVPNFQLPHTDAQPRPMNARKVTFIGFGGIIKQKHLPALKKLGFSGSVNAYDVRAFKDPAGYDVRAIEGSTIEPADLHVIASPGRFHNQAIPLLRKAAGPILVEKPLCYTDPELDEWIDFDRSRPASGKVYVLQNSRFKPNVMQMIRHLQTYNPGRLLHVEVNYQSPSVSLHSPAWRRDERGSQTLLLDYSLHYLDVAMMFTNGPWDLKDLRWEMNYQGQTGLIEGRMTSQAYPVSFLLRQGFITRRARILFTFENYLCSLGFFPDTFVPHMGFDSWSLYKMESRRNFRATAAKVVDKLIKRESDDSHALAMMAALGDDRLARSLSLANLENGYRLLFKMGREVYSG
ncbi:MAG: NAD-dependent epimerase/dehydratase family protein [Planctomycetota bacterium]|nr:NAD-dependent epimerase/dehydratase family protein [Planctomycetota bacterium]